MSQAALREAAAVSKAWPFEEARKLAARVERTGQRQAVFATGYGPSGLPHIGTFGEVARTTMVRHAFRALTDDKIATRLIAFSDDMDGLRKTPDNIPNRAMVAQHLGKPLSEVPDPFGEYESFAAHNNARLRRFLDGFGFDYEFASSSDYYKSGRFDAALMHMLRRVRRGAGDHAAEPARGARGDLFAVPADPSAHPRRHAGPAARLGRRKGDDPLARSRHGRRVRDPGHRRQLQAAVEAGLGDALVCARRRLRNVRQGLDRFRSSSPRRSSGRSAASPPPASTTNCSSTKRARRSPSRGGTA